MRKKPRLHSPNSNRFALLSPVELAGGRRLRLKKKRQLNSAGDSTSAEEEEEEEEDEDKFNYAMTGIIRLRIAQ